MGSTTRPRTPIADGLVQFIGEDFERAANCFRSSDQARDVCGRALQAVCQGGVADLDDVGGLVARIVKLLSQMGQQGDQVGSPQELRVFTRVFLQRAVNPVFGRCVPR